MSANASIWEYYFVFAICIVTFSCLLFVIIPFLFMPSLRNSKLELIFYLAIATIFKDSSYMIKWNLTDRDFLCKVQSFIMVSTETSQYIWGFIIDTLFIMLFNILSLIRVLRIPYQSQDELYIFLWDIFCP